MTRGADELKEGSATIFEKVSVSLDQVLRLLDQVVVPVLVLVVVLVVVLVLVMVLVMVVALVMVLVVSAVAEDSVEFVVVPSQVIPVHVAVGTSVENGGDSVRWQSGFHQSHLDEEDELDEDELDVGEVDVDEVDAVGVDTKIDCDDVEGSVEVEVEGGLSVAVVVMEVVEVDMEIEIEVVLEVVLDVRGVIVHHHQLKISQSSEVEILDSVMDEVLMFTEGSEVGQGLTVIVESREALLVPVLVVLVLLLRLLVVVVGRTSVLPSV